MCVKRNILTIKQNTSGSRSCQGLISTLVHIYSGVDKSLAQPGRKQATATEDFEFHIPFIIIIGGILVLFIYTGVLISP